MATHNPHVIVELVFSVTLQNGQIKDYLTAVCKDLLIVTSPPGQRCHLTTASSTSYTRGFRVFPATAELVALRQDQDPPRSTR